MNTKTITTFWLRPILLCIIFSFLSIAHASAQQVEHHRIEVKLEQKDLVALHEKGLDVDHFHYENGKMTAEVSAIDLELLKKEGFRYKMLIKNLGKNIVKHNRKIDRKAARRKNRTAALNIAPPANFSLGSMGGMHTFTEMEAVLDKMQSLYPDLISTKTSIGTTEEGRPIYMVRISDNPDVDEEESELLFTALHHAREPIGLSQLLFFMWNILENYDSDPEIKNLVDNTELYLVPCVNPDGYVYNQTTNPNGGGFWRKNRTTKNSSGVGTDLNRNYGYEWGYDNRGSSTNPRSDTYRGRAAFSEPETQAIKKLTEEHNFVIAMNYHSYSNLLIYPWGYRSNFVTPDDGPFRAMSEYMVEANNYTYGTPNQTVGYNANGASDDWMYGEQTTKPKILAITPEVGSFNDGFWPASSKVVPLCNDTYPMNLKVMQMGTEYAKLTPASNSPLETRDGNLAYTLQRFSIKEADWSVSISSSSPYVSSVGAVKKYTGLDFRESTDDNINFELAANTPKGTTIPFVITVDNGTWSTKTEVSITYDGPGDISCQSDEDKVNNGRRSNAQPIVSGSEISGLIDTSRDYDHYSFELTDASRVNITLDNLVKDYNIRLLDNSGRTIAISRRRGNRAERIARRLPTGQYFIRVSGFRGAFDTEQCYALNLESSSVTTMAQREGTPTEDLIEVYPNPVEDVLYLKNLASDKEILSLTIVEINGRTLSVIPETDKIKKIKSEGIDVSKLVQGTYIIKVQTTDGVSVMRFLKN